MKQMFVLAAWAIGMVASAQESGKFRMGLEAFYAKPSPGNGAGAALEPKFNIADDMNVGLRLSYGYLSRNDLGALLRYEPTEEAPEEYLYDEKIDDHVFNIAATFDYYFDDLTGGSFVPFAGAGLQYSTISNDYIDTSGLGGLVRVGFEWGKFRLSADYNILKTIDFPNAASNNYLAVNLGFYMGGGKW